MVRVVELETLLAGASPLVFDAGQAPAVKIGCTDGAMMGAARPLVRQDQRREDADAQEEPGGAEGVGKKENPAAMKVRPATAKRAVPKLARTLVKWATWASRAARRLR